MKESTLVEMQKKVDSLIRVSQKLILEIQQIDSLSRGTITALQLFMGCLLYTSPSPRDRQKSRMPSSA